jgi:hypothetical protein
MRCMNEFAHLDFEITKLTMVHILEYQMLGSPLLYHYIRASMKLGLTWFSFLRALNWLADKHQSK